MRSSFDERRRRARQWLAREPPAEEMLEFYLELLDLQEPIYLEARDAGWKWGHLPVPSLVPRFRRFLEGVRPAATETIANIVLALEAADDEACRGLLEDVARRGSSDGAANRLGREDTRSEFPPRAFLQPIAEATVGPAAQSMGPKADLPLQAACPQCGWPPQTSILRDEVEIKGRRLLVCALCSVWWGFPRSRCAHCGESDPEKLLYHSSESIPHVRVEECRTCRAYLKNVDLRKDGQAVPVVEDLASVEIDVWCDEQGLMKVRRNLLGY